MKAVLDMMAGERAKKGCIAQPDAAKYKGGRMVGITSVGVHIPIYRISRDEMARMWGEKSLGGEKAVAGFDEDSITMAVAASRDAMSMRPGTWDIDGLCFATTTAPYREKQGAAIIASAIDLKKGSLTNDFANSLRAGSLALRSAVDSIQSGSAHDIMVVASDCRLAAPKGRFEQIVGDGAAAVTIGSSKVIASIEGSHSIFNDFTDLWRSEKDLFVQSAEARFVDEVGYTATMKEAVFGVMEKYSLKPEDFSKIVFYAPDARQHAGLAKALGFGGSQVQDPLFAQIGNTGTASALIMMVAALEDAKPGDRILFANYGDGCDTLVFRVTEEISEVRKAATLKQRIAERIPIDYGKYLYWRDLVPLETVRLSDRPEPSLPSRWRERRMISTLYGVRCRACGTPQIHPIGQKIRICAVCQSKDDFDEYKFSDRRGTLFTYAIDQLQPTRNPPGVNGVVDFEGGGRLICELTDCDAEKIRIGMPVEMTFRKLSSGKGAINYFWKARPVVE
jgi:hydroxymethylglutaryl-CoA synthase